MRFLGTHLFSPEGRVLLLMRVFLFGHCHGYWNFERRDGDIVQTLTLSNGLLTRNLHEKRANPLEISFTRTPEPIVLLHKASTS